jgi:hypothetical protein
MAADYNKASPYASTNSYSFFLDIANIPNIPVEADDVQYQIDAIYKHRPDLLAFDLYENTALWWVFCIRNPNVLQDPVFDFVPGATIYIPKKSTIQNALGI